MTDLDKFMAGMRVKFWAEAARYARSAAITADHASGLAQKLAEGKVAPEQEFEVKTEEIQAAQHVVRKLRAACGSALLAARDCGAEPHKD